MPMSPRLLRPRASSALVATDADAKAYINAVRTADGGQYMEAAVQRAIDNFIVGCKADGIWSAIKASCILMGARTLSGALTPLVGTAPTNNGPFVSGDYNRKTGLVGNGSSKYLDSNRNGNSDPQNSHHQAVFVTSKTSNTAVLIGAGFNLTGSTRLAQIPSTSSVSVRCRTSFPLTITPTLSVATDNSLFGVSRSSSSLTTARSAGSNGTSASSPDTSYNGNVFVFASNNAGTAEGWADWRLGFYSIGEHLDLALLDSRLGALRTAIGAAIP